MVGYLFKDWRTGPQETGKAGLLGTGIAIFLKYGAAGSFEDCHFCWVVSVIDVAGSLGVAVWLGCQ